MQKYIFGKIANHLDPEIREMLVRGLYGNKNSTFHSGLQFTFYSNLN